jgi:NAD(P)H-dependent FMN reductase
MSQSRIGIIISTTREGRFGDKPAQWIFELARARGGADFELIDLRDFPLPFFNELKSPVWESPKNEGARRWSRKVGEFDGFIFVTGEYNHGIPGVLKNALDHTYKEFNRKPAAFVGYGGVGAARAIEHLRLIAVELQVAPLRSAVHVGMAEFLGMLQQGKTFADYPYLGQSAEQMLDDLIWWTNALKAGRQASA